MKTIGLLFIYLFVSFFASSQVPVLAKKWDKRFGGTMGDLLSSVIQTKDGGYLLSGSSYSNVSGDKTQPNWDTLQTTMDYWVIKIDSIGNKQWDKRFGGTDQDRFYCVVETMDGGYVLGGYSNSGISGDKTQDDWDTTLIYTDYWIVKIDFMGNKQWDKRFGGLIDDELSSLQQTKDSGYILGGHSRSGIGGDKTQANWEGNDGNQYDGPYDYWVVKIDGSGNKQWDKRYGGFGDEELVTILQTNDDGYILGGSSNSGVSGDKTQANWDTTLRYSDYWIVKIDSIGNKQWDKRFGGIADDILSSLGQTMDGGYILAGSSNSSADGDKTQPSVGAEYYYLDYWIVKIDSSGNKQWDKTFGGIYDDMLYSVYQTSDKGYLVSGASDSPLSGAKSENNLGKDQGWIVKLDSLGNKQWDKTIFTTDSAYDVQAYAIENSDGCYAIAEMSSAGIGGYKTQSNWDITNSTVDFWIVQFCDTVISDGIPTITKNGATIFISPNPFTTDIAISIQMANSQQADFTIYNMIGQAVYSKQENNLSSHYTKMLDLSYLPNGVYFVKVVVDGESAVKEMVKE